MKQCRDTIPDVKHVCRSAMLRRPRDNVRGVVISYCDDAAKLLLLLLLLLR